MVNFEKYYQKDCMLSKKIFHALVVPKREILGMISRDANRMEVLQVPYPSKKNMELVVAAFSAKVGKEITSHPWICYLLTEPMFFFPHDWKEYNLTELIPSFRQPQGSVAFQEKNEICGYVYFVEEGFITWMRSEFPGIIFRHSAYSVIPSACSISAENGDIMLVQIFHNFMEAVFASEGKFIHYFMKNILSAEDILYYLLNTIGQFDKKPHTIKVFLYEMNPEHKNLYDVLKDYVWIYRHVLSFGQEKSINWLFDHYRNIYENTGRTV